VRLRTSDPPAPTLALVAAVALHEAVSQFCPQARIKWPNDLMVDDAKLAGILLEREGEAVVIGFGVNLAEHPRFLERPATSLSAVTDAGPDAEVFLQLLAGTFAHWLGRWRTAGMTEICRRWLEAAHPVGSPLATHEGAGLFDGLEPDGALRLRLPDGSTRTIHAGDVFLI
jgi:BirA family transcriptional regulator, biotin operon repressor / biotin---[acetyl-CoA-carboxylase] ligase